MTTLGKSVALSCSLAFPPAGDWQGDVTLDGGDVPAVGAAVLTFGDLAIQCSVIRSGEDYAGKPHAVLCGAPGWQTYVSRPLSFQVDSGVRLGTVLDALASGAGQRIEKPADSSVGEYYEVVSSRGGEPVTYADALNALVRDGHIVTWRVDPDGVTRFVARVAAAVQGRADLVKSDPMLKMGTWGLDKPATWLPGNTVTPEGGAAVTIRRIEFRETGRKLEADVYEAGATAPGTLYETVQRMVALAIESEIRVYRVSACRADKSLDLAPPPDSPHLPELQAVKVFGLAGSRTTPATDSEVLVWMRRRNRPICFAFDAATIATAITLGAADDAAAKPVAYKGGTTKTLLPPLVFQGFVTGAIVGGTPQGPLPATGVLTYPGSYTMGTIETGSPNTAVKTP
jgi:hypothetical protein